MGENFIDLSDKAYGIYIPEDEVLKRIKYQWFSVMSSNEILDKNIIISKYMKSTLVDSTKSRTINEMPTAVSI